MIATVAGIHHVTAITADAQANLDFYCRVLGLRLVKLTVNFDDPESYHLYYANESGSPGSILTFFSWPGARRGRVGPPQVTAISFAVPAQSLEFWNARLKEHGVIATRGNARFSEQILGFEDPDGIWVELIGVERRYDYRPAGGPIPAESAISAFHGVTISEEGHEKTAKLLTETMGFREEGREGGRFRYLSSNAHSAVDLLCVPTSRRGVLGAGVVHHIAWRTPDDPQQALWRNRLVELDFNVSPIMNRVYFHSIYFREPGGVLFEIATDPPGFTFDEPIEQLGTGLKLPPWLEPRRAELQRILPPLHLPEW